MAQYIPAHSTVELIFHEITETKVDLIFHKVTETKKLHVKSYHNFKH